MVLYLFLNHPKNQQKTLKTQLGNTLKGTLNITNNVYQKKHLMK